MRPNTVLVRLALCLASLSSVTSAWSDLSQEGDALIARQNNNDNDSEETSSRENDRSTITEPPSSRTESESERETGTSRTRNNDDEESSSDDGDLNTARPETGSRTGSRARTSTRTEFEPDAPPGGVQMTEPKTTLEPTPLYKQSDFVTFGWNYTSLQGTPTAVDVLVSCSLVMETWTLTANMSFETAVSYVWDTKDQANDPNTPLPDALYTLIIKDSDAEISDIPDPGYLGAYAGFTFGVYERRKPTPYSGGACIGCSAAPSLLHRPALGFAVTMSLISLFSFTWFVTGLGLQ